MLNIIDDRQQAAGLGIIDDRPNTPQAQPKPQPKEITPEGLKITPGLGTWWESAGKMAKPLASIGTGLATMVPMGLHTARTILDNRPEFGTGRKLSLSDKEMKAKKQMEMYSKPSEYFIQTKEDEEIANTLMKPIEWVDTAGRFYGDMVEQGTGSPELAATTKTAFEYVAFFGLPKLKARLIKSVKAGNAAKIKEAALEIRKESLRKLQAEPERFKKLAQAEHKIKKQSIIDDRQQAYDQSKIGPPLLKPKELDAGTYKPKSVAERLKEVNTETPSPEKPRSFAEELKAEFEKPSIKPNEKINGITRERAGEMIAEGNPEVIDHIKEGVKKHGVLTMQDAIGNEAMAKIYKSENQKVAMSNFERLKPSIDEALQKNKPMPFIDDRPNILRSALESERGSVEIDLEPLKKAAESSVKEVRETGREIGKTLDEYLGSISTRLENIDPSLKTHMRKFEMRRGIKATERTLKVEPLLKKIKGMKPEDRIKFDIARKNASDGELSKLINKYNIGKEYSELRNMLDDVYKEAEKVGYDIGYRKHFHPRAIKDAKGFLEEAYNSKEWPTMERAIRAKEVELGRYLEAEEKAQVINQLLRGYPQNQISLSRPGQLKARQFEKIPKQYEKYYMDSDAALLKYIQEVTDAIEARKVFGKGKKGADINDTIGGYVLDLMHKKKITPEQEMVLRDIYNARFNEMGTRGIFSIYKNLSYIDTMGSAMSAITQIGDLAWSLYKSGIPKTTGAIARAIVGKSEIKIKDIGIDRIAQEFADTTKSARAVEKVFKLTGFEKIDFLGKETLINSTINKARKMARDPKKVEALRKELQPIFEGETDSLIRDLAAGRTTENVKLHAFNTLSDFQPISLSEMPQKYLTGGNGRIFYMLKTFTLKQFDIYRREVFRQIKTPGQRMKGIRNLTRLTACFAVANATADMIKDVILNRPIDLEDKVVDNLLRLFGISKFLTWKAREEGAGSAIVRQVAPPFKFIDAVTKDITNIKEGKKLEMPASIPIVGKFYYWWFGKGAEKSKKRKKKGSTRYSPSGMPGLSDMRGL